MNKIEIPELSKVDSSMLNAIGYLDNDLYIEFKNGSLYKYNNVPKELYEDFKNSESKGTFVNSFIKCAGFTFCQLR